MANNRLSLVTIYADNYIIQAQQTHFWFYELALL